MLARADEILYTRKRASKKKHATSKGKPKAASAPDLHSEAKQLPLQSLVDFTCPHCQRMNAIAVIHDDRPGKARQEKVFCAHCKKSWELITPGPVMAGPFAK